MRYDLLLYCHATPLSKSTIQHCTTLLLRPDHLKPSKETFHIHDLSISFLFISCAMARRYTHDELVELRASPLVPAKPAGLPPVEEWMGYAIALSVIGLLDNGDAGPFLIRHKSQIK